MKLPKHHKLTKTNTVNLTKKSYKVHHILKPDGTTYFEVENINPKF